MLDDTPNKLHAIA